MDYLLRCFQLKDDDETKVAYAYSPALKTI